MPASKRAEIKTSAKHSSQAGKAEYTNTKQGIRNEVAVREERTGVALVH